MLRDVFSETVECGDGEHANSVIDASVQRNQSAAARHNEQCSEESATNITIIQCVLDSGDSEGNYLLEHRSEGNSVNSTTTVLFDVHSQHNHTDDKELNGNERDLTITPKECIVNASNKNSVSNISTVLRNLCGVTVHSNLKNIDSNSNDTVNNSLSEYNNNSDSAITENGSSDLCASDSSSVSSDGDGASESSETPSLVSGPRTVIYESVGAKGAHSSQEDDSNKKPRKTTCIVM